MSRDLERGRAERATGAVCKREREREKLLREVAHAYSRSRHGCRSAEKRPTGFLERT